MSFAHKFQPLQFCGLVLIGALALSAGPAESRRLSAMQATETTLYEWQGIHDNPGHPQGALVADRAGNLYGAAGSFPGQNPGEFGSIFELSPPTASHEGWSEKTLYRFRGAPDGNFPAASLVFGADGALYGTTEYGGILRKSPDKNKGYFQYGAGTIFRLAPPAVPNGAWTEQVLYAFDPAGTVFPHSELLPGPSGEFYGTTEGFEHRINMPGTIYALYPPAKPGGAWQKVTLYSFPSGTSCGYGGQPQGGLIADAKGNLYGTDYFGGTVCEGSVFKLVRSGTLPWALTVLHSFNFLLGRNGSRDGEFPESTLLAGPGGVLYGTTSMGGSGENGEPGTVFELVPPSRNNGSWTESVIHSFHGPDGYWPSGTLVSDATGALYGSTFWGGPIGHGKRTFFGNGLSYKLTPQGNTWAETILFQTHGGVPYDGQDVNGLIEDAMGTLYGTTVHGGTFGAGLFFKIAQ